MATNIGGGGMGSQPLISGKDEVIRALVITDVKVIEKIKEVIIPQIKYMETEQVKYVTKDEPQFKYITKELDTVKYKVKEEDTTRFVVKEEETIKYVPREVSVEKPVIVDKPYERPVIKEKEYVIATVKDIENLRELMDLVPKLITQVQNLKIDLNALRNYKLIEEVVKVPKVEWINTPVERIVWKDVERTK